VNSEIKLKTVQELKAEQDKPKVNKNEASVKVGDHTIVLQNKLGVWKCPSTFRQ
jgi:hypothetical protein